MSERKRIVAVIQAHRLFYRTCLQSRQAPHRIQKVPVRARVIVRPTGMPRSPVPAGMAEARVWNRWIHQPRENPFRFVGKIGRQRNLPFMIFVARKLPERLRQIARRVVVRSRINNAQQAKQADQNGRQFQETIAQYSLDREHST